MFKYYPIHVSMLLAVVFIQFCYFINFLVEYKPPTIDDGFLNNYPGYVMYSEKLFPIDTSASFNIDGVIIFPYASLEPCPSSQVYPSQTKED